MKDEFCQTCRRLITIEEQRNYSGRHVCLILPIDERQLYMDAYFQRNPPKAEKRVKVPQ